MIFEDISEAKRFSFAIMNVYIHQRLWRANDLLLYNAIDIEMQSDMLIILSSLCEGDIHRKELFGSEGHSIDIVTHYLKMDPTKVTSGLGHHRLMLATVDVVWSVRIWCLVSVEYFMVFAAGEEKDEMGLKSNVIC